MNPFPFRFGRLLILPILLSALPAPSWAEVGDKPGSQPGRGRGGYQPIDKNQVIINAKGEFQEVRTLVGDDAEHGFELLNLVDRTQNYFTNKAPRQLPENDKHVYRQWESDYISEVTTKVIIPHARKTVATNADASLDETTRQQAQDANKQQAQAALNGVTHNMGIRVFSEAVTMGAGAGLQTGAGRKGTPGGASPDGVVANPSDVPRGDPEEWFKRQLQRSPVAGLTNTAALWALSNEPKIPPDPGGSGGGSSGSGSGGGGASAGDVIDSISGAGGSQLLANHASAALKNGNFQQAYQDAQQVLKLDPENKLAMAVSQFSAGRVGAAPGGAAGAGGAGGAAGSSGASGDRSLMGGAGHAASYGSSPRAAVGGRSAADFGRAGKNALQLGDRAGARGYADRGLAAFPGDTYLLGLRASISLQQREYANALADARAGLEKDPRNITLLRAKAFAENRLKRWRDAQASAGLLLELNPKDAYGYAYRGHAYGGMGDRDAMLSDIRRAAQLDASFADAARQAEALQLPSNADLMFLFPGEAGPAPAAAAAPGGRNRRFGLLVGVSALGGLLLAFGLLQTVLAPLKEKVTSVFTKITRTGPSTKTFAAPAAGPVSTAGALPGLIRGQYEVSRQIGAGGMGMVFEGTDHSLGRRVAIKKMRDEIRYDARERARFVTEAKTVAALHHANIVDIYAIAEDGDDVFLVFEYVDGKTVHDLVQAGGLDPAVTGRVVGDVAAALDYAHSRGVIHRDMKPSNVMVDGKGRVKVMDFGIARVAKDAMTRFSVTNTVVGTPPYMAPEQEQGQVRRESDVYALAVCAYEMLTGKLPFTGTGGGMMLNKINMSYVPPSRQKEGLPPALDAVFERAFQADPEKRHRTPGEFSAALAGALPAAARA